MKNRVVRVGAGLSAFCAALVGLAAGAGATPTDVTGGAYSSAITSVTDWITNFGIAPLFALAALVLVIAVALRWFRKGRSVGSA